MHTVHNKTLSERAIESCVIVRCFCDPSDYNSANWQLCLEVIILIIRELIKAGTHGHVTCNLNEATGFGNIGDIANS